MKTTRTHNLLVVLLVEALAFAATVPAFAIAGGAFSDINSAIGNLKYEAGYPSMETFQDLYTETNQTAATASQEPEKNPAKYPYALPFLAEKETDTIYAEANQTATVPSQEPEKNPEKYPYALPFLAQKAIDAGQGDALPLPLGISVAYYYVERDIDVKSVSASLGNRPLQSVDNLVNFDVRTKVSTTSMRLDAWLFPFLNVYGLIAKIDNESAVNMQFTIGNNPTSTVQVDGGFDGIGTGVGVVLAGGYENFFMTFDANWLQSDLGDDFDTTFEGQIYSLRAGWKGAFKEHNTRLWLGATYWDTERTMRGTVGSGATAINFEVTQAPKNPTTFSLGSNYEFTKKINLVADFGFNFDGDHIVLLSLNYRFF